jgi:hypothetical protein
LRWRHDAQLFAAVVNDPNLANADAFVDADAIIPSWAAIESDNYLL